MNRVTSLERGGARSTRSERLINLENPGAWAPAEPRGRSGVLDTVRAVNDAAIQSRRIRIELTTDASMAWDPERVEHVRFPFSA